MPRPKGSKSKEVHFWTIEEKEHLRDIVESGDFKTTRDILKLLNERCEYQFNLEQVKRAITANKLKTGLTGYFTKGATPWNKGTKGYTCTNRTTFKKGNIPHNHRPVGSERTTVDGYREIKIAEPNKWKLKHRLLWETNNGPIPRGYIVIFADGDKGNISIDNLLLISRKQGVKMNQYDLIKEDAELTKTGVLIADLILKIGERKK